MLPDELNDAGLEPARLRRRTVLAGLAAAAGLGVLGGAMPAFADDAGAALPAKDVTAALRLWNYLSEPIPAWWNNGIANFNKEYPNVKVDSTVVPYANMTAKLFGSGISHSIPDGMLYNPADSQKLFSAGIIQEMTSFWSAYPDKAQFPSSVVWKSGDKVLSVQGYVNTTAIWYNKTILDKAGVAIPKTIDDFGAALKKAHDAGFGGFLLSAEPNGSGEFDFLPWLYAYGQNYGKWDKPTVEKVFALFGQWIDAGYIPKDVTNNNENDNGNVFANGKYAFVQNGNWNLGAARKAKYPFDWGVADFPTGPAGAHGIGGGEGFSIGKTSKNPALVFELFRIMLLERDAELANLKETGSLPARNDAASDPLIASNPDLATYAKVVQELGSRPNTPKVSDYLNDMGKIWNAFAGGSIDAGGAADQVVQQLSAL